MQSCLTRIQDEHYDEVVCCQIEHVFDKALLLLGTANCFDKGELVLAMLEDLKSRDGQLGETFSDRIFDGAC